MPSIKDGDLVDKAFWFYEETDLPAIGIDITETQPTIDRVSSSFESVFAVSKSELIGKKVSDVVSRNDGLFKPVPDPDVMPNGSLADVDLIHVDGESYLRSRIAGSDYILDRFHHAQSDLPQHQYLGVLQRVIRHDLRNHTSEVLGWIEVVEDNIGDNPDMVETGIEHIRRTCTELEEMYEEVKQIENVLYSDGDLHYLDLESAVAETVAGYKQKYDNERIKVDIPSNLNVLANPRLQIVIDHLIDNAFEHNDEETVVEVEARQNSDRSVVLTVSDTGSGLPEDEQDVLHGECDTDDFNHSEGLGLWIVKWVTDEYNADITVETSEEDGTTIDIELGCERKTKPVAKTS